MKDYPLARLLALRAIELDDKNADLLNLLGVASMQSNQAQDAADAFKRALRVNGKHGPAQANLGALWLVYGDADRGRDLINKAGSVDSGPDVLPQVRGGR